MNKYFGTIFICSLFALTVVGCARKPSPEELTVLQEQTRSADAAEHRVQILHQEQDALRSELQLLELQRTKLNAQLVDLERTNP